MKTIKIADATNPQINWLVAKIEFPNDTLIQDTGGIRPDMVDHAYPYTEDPAQMWPIIEREAIQLTPYGAASSQPKNIEYWCAAMYLEAEMVEGYGPTSLVAAARCYVASKFGETAEVPEELA